MGQFSTFKRNLHPRVEVNNYVETTDNIVLLSDIDEYKLNGYANDYDCSDSDDDIEFPPIPSPKVCFNHCVPPETILQLVLTLESFFFQVPTRKCILGQSLYLFQTES